MEQRVSLITFAIDDLPQAVAFYQNMGWQAAQTGPGVAAFNPFSPVSDGGGFHWGGDQQSTLT